MIAEAPESVLCRADVRRRFDRAAAKFDEVDFVHGVTRDGLLARLEPMLVEAKTIIDLGCATGTASKLLAKRFGRARIIGIDLSLPMLRQASAKKSWLQKSSCLQADAARLPFGEHSVDIVFANLLLPWIDDVATVFNEVARILAKGGLFLFSTLGPDSLAELRRAWRAADAEAHVHPFLDMHDIGDAAVRAGLRDPVLDVDRLAITYQSSAALFADLTAAGARNSLRLRRRSLVGKRRFGAMTEAIEASRTNGVIKLELELVYGHCWGSGHSVGESTYQIDAGSIGRRR